MNELRELIENFITNNEDIKSFISNVKSISNLDESIYDISDTHNLDEKMILLLLTYINNFKNIKIKETNNPYMSFIYEILDGSNVFETILIDDKTIYVYKTISNDETYFLINPTNNEIIYKLPNELLNKTFFCFNCNDDMELKETITLPDFSFYALKK